MKFTISENSSKQHRHRHHKTLSKHRTLISTSLKSITHNSAYLAFFSVHNFAGIYLMLDKHSIEKFCNKLLGAVGTGSNGQLKC